MKTDVLSWQGECVDSVDLRPDVFGVEPKREVLFRVVLWQLAKRRLGCSKTKEISEVSGTTAKPYKQKRTGRARQGSLRSPQFRGGAIVFGPVHRKYGGKLNKKVRVLGLRMALSMKYAEGNLLILEDSGADFSKTADAAKWVSSVAGGGRVSLLVVGNCDDKVRLCLRNLVGVDLIASIGVNVYDVLRHGKVVLTVSAVKSLEERLL